jgi:hypothetical protein
MERVARQGGPRQDLRLCRGQADWFIIDRIEIDDDDLPF